MPNAFDNALNQLARAQAVLPFDAAFLEKIKTPDRIIEKTLEVTMDDGSKKSFHAYRVQHNNARGPYKGGIRYHPQVDLNEVKALALWMAMKTAVVNISMGGGKGGIEVDPKKLSKNELEKLSRAWARAFAEDIGPQKDVPAPDVNTTPEIMAWMADEYAKVTGEKTGATFTGKPLDKGGSEGRGEATAMGGFYVFEALKEKLGLPSSCAVVIQGFGNAGGHAAELWKAAGHRIIGTSDSQGAVVNEAGLDIAALEKHKKETGHVVDFPGTRTITNEELLTLSCDLLIPAALENQLTQKNAGDVKAKVILELANGPTTPEADDILFGCGIPVIPDILANAGGVTVSTFEWEQNLKGEHWTEEVVLHRLREIMTREALAIHARATDLKTDLRRAAFVVAMERIQKAMK